MASIVKELLTCRHIDSHKMEIIQELSDKIIVLDKGSIIAEGTHEELYESCSLYRTLVNKG